MRDPWQWEEDDLQALVGDQRKEDLSLDYKRSDSLANTDANKREISKDVSAMANSAGGVIVYGIDEQKSTQGPIRFDAGIDPNVTSKEWLEQVIDSGVQRKIDGVKVHPVMISQHTPPIWVYVVWIPQSNRAPHMAKDHRFYKRTGTMTSMMEEYEIRDVGRRAESPDLHLGLRVSSAGASTVRLHPRISNRSPEAVFYASIRVYAQEGLQLEPNLKWSALESAPMLWNNRDRLVFSGLRQNWSVRDAHPILDGEYFDLMHLNIHWPYVGLFSVGWELLTPKAAPRLQGVKLRVEESGPAIVGYFPLLHL